MSKALTFLALAALSVVALSGCATEPEFDPSTFEPTGVWQHEEDGHTTTMHLADDGQITVTDMPEVVASSADADIDWGNKADYVGCWFDPAAADDVGEPTFVVRLEGLTTGLSSGQIRVEGQDAIYFYYGHDDPLDKFEFARVDDAAPDSTSEPADCS